MTLEDLLDIHEDRIKDISDDTLRTLCQPFWNITRPELAALQPKKGAPKKKVDRDYERRLAEAKQLAFEKLGLKIK